ncbi:MAG: FecR domain-containing protein [Nitrosomonas sp.]|nr:FecR domain-containing protein [Nitrosomonas sp.]
MKSARPAHTRPPSDDVVNQAAEWIVRLSDDDLTLADLAVLQAEFEQWQQISPHHAEAAHKMLMLIEQSKWIRTTAHPASAHAAMEVSLAKKRRTTRVRKLGVTLLLIVTLALPVQIFFQHYPPAYLLADVRTGTGQWHTQTLVDNSTITLNGTSAANFHFNATQRNLELVHGDILIDVAADPIRPFEVKTRHGWIRALGTRFIVNLDNETTTLTMLESKVAVTLHESGGQRQTGNAAETLTLDAGQRVQFSNRWIGDIENVNIREISDAWKFRHLIVENQPLPEVLDTLSRYRTGLIHYNTQVLEHMKVSAVLPLDDIDKALYLLARSFPIQVRTITPWLVIVEADTRPPRDGDSLNSDPNR